jgi:hypothetical protein
MPFISDVPAHFGICRRAKGFRRAGRDAREPADFAGPVVEEGKQSIPDYAGWVFAAST